MIIKFPYRIKDDNTLKELLTHKVNPSYSFKHFLYYRILRPFFPMRLRYEFQRIYNCKLNYQKSFIYDELVEYIKKNSLENFSPAEFYPGNYNTAIILTHDVDYYEGLKFIPTVMQIEEDLGFKSCWNIVPYKYKIDTEIIRLIQNNNHEIGIHGYNHDGKLYSSKKIFNERVKYINYAIKKYSAVGFRSPMMHHNLEWQQALDIQYDSSCFDYDPFQPFPDNTGFIWPFIAGKFVELPYTLPQDHTLFYILKQKDINIWEKKISWLIKNKGMILTLTHPEYLKNKNYLNMYRELLLLLKEVEAAWYCLPKDFACWWKDEDSRRQVLNLAI